MATGGRATGRTAGPFRVLRPLPANDAGTLARAAGLGAFPYFVFVHADGTVARRTVGQLSIAELETILGTLRR